MAIIQALTKPQPKSRRTSIADPVRAYLNEIGRYPLLTHEQELEYGRKIQVWQKAKTEWSKLDRSTQQKLEREGKRSLEIMQRSNLRLVVAVAKKYQNRGVEFLDLIQEGSIGLRTAAVKFDPTQGYKFSTYAYWWIRQAMTRSLSNSSRIIRTPVHVAEKIVLIRRCVEEIIKQGKKPTRSRVLALIEERSDIGIESFEKILDNPTYLHVRSLDSPVTSRFDDTDEVGYFLADECDLMEQAIDQETIEFARSMITTSNLTEAQKTVIRLRFGIDGNDVHTLEEIGEILDLSRERIRQIQKKALYKLRQVADRD